MLIKHVSCLSILSLFANFALFSGVGMGFSVPTARSSVKGNNSIQLSGGSDSVSNRANFSIQDALPTQVSQPSLFCSSVNVILNIFGGVGKINIDGTSYSNGNTVSLCSGEKYTISPSNVASGYSFFEWEETGGEFGGTSNSWTIASTTTFYPDVSYCELALILNATDPQVSPFIGSWSGYVESGTAFARVSATFAVQSVSYISGVKNNSHPQEFVLQWVGIGGLLGTAALWQIGLIYMVNSSTSKEQVQGFYETTGGSSGNTGFVFVPFHTYPGDTVTAVVTYSNGICRGYLNDSTTGSKFSTSNIEFSPNTQTADWVVEDPQTCGVFGCLINQYVIPQFGSMSFGSISSTAGTLVGPVVVLWTWVEWSLSSGGNLIQYMYPKIITSSDTSIVTYSQGG